MVSRFVFGSLKLLFFLGFAPRIDLFWVNRVQRLGILEGFKSLVLVDNLGSSEFEFQSVGI